MVDESISPVAFSSDLIILKSHYFLFVDDSLYLGPIVRLGMCSVDSDVSRTSRSVCGWMSASRFVLDETVLIVWWNSFRLKGNGFC